MSLTSAQRTEFLKGRRLHMLLQNDLPPKLRRIWQKCQLIDFLFHSFVSPLLPSFADSLTYISVSNIEKKIRVNRIDCLIALRKLGL